MTKCGNNIDGKLVLGYGSRPTGDTINHKVGWQKEKVNYFSAHPCNRELNIFRNQCNPSIRNTSLPVHNWHSPKSMYAHKTRPRLQIMHKLDIIITKKRKKETAVIRCSIFTKM